jgi:hypothetical protein
MAFQSPFGSTATTTAFNGFGQTWPTTPAVVQPPAAPAADKGQIIVCLTESKNMQAAILEELRSMNAKLTAQIAPMAPKQIHHSVFCNVCNKNNITGARYKCLFCKDFDMCEECEAKPVTMHDPSHVFVKIKDTQAFNAKMATRPSCFAS